MRALNRPWRPGASYTDNESITLPANAATGSQYLIFVTNYDAVEGDTYYGSIAQGETDYANNTFAVPITVSAPDLTITTATAPASAIWKARSACRGPCRTSAASTPPATGTTRFTSAARHLRRRAAIPTSPASPRASNRRWRPGPAIRTTSRSSLPADAATGSQYLIFVTNYYAVEGDIYYGSNAQGETDYANNTFAVPITVSAPDLTITTAAAPSSAILRSSINVSWTVQNIGQRHRARRLVRRGLHRQLAHLRRQQRHLHR